MATGPENILVTPGAIMSVATAFMAILDPEDEILLPDPGWPNYAMAVSLAYGRSVFYNLQPQNNFLPDLQELETLVTPKTKMILLCTPSNPTGQVYDADLMQALMDFAQRHALYVLSDEIYGEIVFDHAGVVGIDEVHVRQVGAGLEAAAQRADGNAVRTDGRALVGAVVGGDEAHDLAAAAGRLAVLAAAGRRLRRRRAGQPGAEVDYGLP